jgi:hypothetical protein
MDKTSLFQRDARSRPLRMDIDSRCEVVDKQPSDFLILTAVHAGCCPGAPFRAARHADLQPHPLPGYVEDARV